MHGYVNIQAFFPQYVEIKKPYASYFERPKGFDYVVKHVYDCIRAAPLSETWHCLKEEIILSIGHPSWRQLRVEVQHDNKTISSTPPVAMQNIWHLFCMLA